MFRRRRVKVRPENSKAINDTTKLVYFCGETVFFKTRNMGMGYCLDLRCATKVHV